MVSEGWSSAWVIPQELPCLCCLGVSTSACSAVPPLVQVSPMIISPCSAPDNTMHSLFSFLSLFADVAIPKKP